MFKKFRHNWKDKCADFAKGHFCDKAINELLMFYVHKLEKSIIPDDYHELIKLWIIFLAKDEEEEKKVKIDFQKQCIKLDRWQSYLFFENMFTVDSVQNECQRQLRFPRCLPTYCDKLN